MSSAQYVSEQEKKEGENITKRRLIYNNIAELGQEAANGQSNFISEEVNIAKSKFQAL